MKTGLNMKNQMLHADDVIARLEDMKPLVVEENPPHFDKTKSRNKSYCIRWGRNAQRSEDLAIYEDYILALRAKKATQVREEPGMRLEGWLFAVAIITTAVVSVAITAGTLLYFYQ